MSRHGGSRLEPEAEPQTHRDADDQIALEARRRRERDEAMERELIGKSEAPHGTPYVNAGAYDEDKPDPPAPDPDRDPRGFDAWKRLVERPELVVERSGGASGRRRREPRRETIDDRRERRRHALAEDDLYGPRVEMVSGRVSAEARAGLAGDDETTVGELMEAVGQFARSGGRLKVVVRIVRGMRDARSRAGPKPTDRETAA